MTRRDYFRGIDLENKNRNDSLNILGITVKKLKILMGLQKLPTIGESRAYIKKYIKNWYDSAGKFWVIWKGSGLRICF